jgi:hypothetical protein
VFVAGTPVSFYPAPVDEIILAVGFKMNINIAREHMRTLGPVPGEERFGNPRASVFVNRPSTRIVCRDIWCIWKRLNERKSC